MSCRRQKTELETAKKILSYFLRSPQAADSLEGIGRWRLLEERIHRSVRETEQALCWLVSRGFLLEDSRPGSPRVYSLNQEKRADAECFLMQGEGSGTRGDN